MCRDDFNPRLHAGGDAILPLAPFYTRLFQSTPPRRRRPGPAGRQYRALTDFNPRLHAGGDGDPNHGREFVPGISIHASTQEATETFNTVISVIKFQSTPPRRRRHSANIRFLAKIAFQSTPPRRRRPPLFPYVPVSNDFNPRLHAGVHPVQSQ